MTRGKRVSNLLKFEKLAAYHKECDIQLQMRHVDFLKAVLVKVLLRIRIVFYRRRLARKNNQTDYQIQATSVAHLEFVSGRTAAVRYLPVTYSSPRHIRCTSLLQSKTYNQTVVNACPNLLRQMIYFLHV